MRTQHTSDRLTLLRYRDLVAHGIVSNRMTLSRWMARPSDPFPRPIRLGENTIAWRLIDVEAWLERRTEARAEEIGRIESLRLFPSAPLHG